MRWKLYENLTKIYQNVSLTFGYITKNVRISNNLPKDHYIDARCISKNPTANSDGIVYYFKKIRRNNRQIHKFKIRKGETSRRLNQAPYEIFNFRLFDKVLYNSNEYFITGRRKSGSFALKDIFGNQLGTGNTSYKKLKFLEHSTGFICQKVINTQL